MRSGLPGHDLIIEQIDAGSKVLDLGCGNGELLQALKDARNVDGYGIEISTEAVNASLARGVYACHGDIDEGLSDYRDASFDYVVLDQTIQNTKKPDLVLQEVVRIGRRVIVSFPNFSYYRLRTSFFFRGSMPKTHALPYEWYNTPNIHMLTVTDFRRFCATYGMRIIQEQHFCFNRAQGESSRRRLLPNLLAEYGFFVIERR